MKRKLGIAVIVIWSVLAGALLALSGCAPREPDWRDFAGKRPGDSTQDDPTVKVQSALSVFQTFRAVNGKSMSYVGNGIKIVNDWMQVPTMIGGTSSEYEKHGPTIGRCGETSVSGVSLEGGVFAQKQLSGAWAYFAYAQIPPNAASISTNIDIQPGHWVQTILDVRPDCPSQGCTWRGAVTVINQTTHHVFRWDGDNGSQPLYPPQGATWWGVDQSAFEPSCAGAQVRKSQNAFLQMHTAAFHEFEFSEYSAAGMVTTNATKNPVVEHMIDRDDPSVILDDSTPFMLGGYGTTFSWHTWGP